MPPLMGISILLKWKLLEMSEDAHIFLGLGSNIGNRYQNLMFGIDMLNSHPHIWVTEKSHVYQSPAMYNIDQNKY